LIRYWHSCCFWFPSMTPGDKQVIRQNHIKDDWLYDVSWSWSDSFPTHDQAESREGLKSLTLAMTHNPTRICLVKSSSLVKTPGFKINQLRTNLWLDLFHELQRRLLSNKDLPVWRSCLAFQTKTHS
jgi:hypothetical protein